MSTQNENNEAPEVLDRKNCDLCHVEGRYVAYKGKRKLTFCAHHIRETEQSLREYKYSITPEDYHLKPLN